MALITHSLLPAFAAMTEERVALSTPDQRPADLPDLRVGIFNLMPDAALEATDRQFIRLVAAYADHANLWVHPFTVPGSRRGPEAGEYVVRHYDTFDQVRRQGLDALIVSGANPAQPELAEEGFWKELIEVLDWAGEHTRGVLCSCLATHAVFERYWGVKRTRLPDKRWGIFPHRIVEGQHRLVEGLGPTVDVPHSHWYDLTADEMTSAGVRVLIEGDRAGVGMAVSRDDFFVLLQAHPEYEPVSLLKEYKREVGRFSSGEADTYPPFPENYFSGPEQRILNIYREKVEHARHRAEAPPPFPGLIMGRRRGSRWMDPGRVIYRNWLSGILHSVSATGRAVR